MNRRKIAIAIIGLFVVAVIGVLVLRGELDDMVADTIEMRGSRLLGTAVTVDDVTLQLREGRATIEGLRVHNPEGFSDRNALVLGRLMLDLEPGSLGSEPYLIQDLAVESASALYEVDDRGRRNLDVLRKNLDATRPDAPPGSVEPAPLLIVQRLRQAGGSVEVDASAVGLEARTATLTDFIMEDLGAPDGEPAGVVGKQVLQRLLEQSVQAAVSEELRDRLREQLGEELGGAVGDRLGDLLDQGE